MKNPQQSQAESIKSHLTHIGAITPLEAMNKYQCMRLAAVVFNLKNDEGMDIVTEIVHDENTGKRYAKYFIPRQQLALAI